MPEHDECSQSKPKGHIENLAGVLRIGGAYGEPYTWSASVRYLSPKKVEVMGAIRSPTLSERKAIGEVLKQYGIDEAVYYRMRENGTVKEVKLTR